MSPSENDLRSSLQQGEGDPVDVDRIVIAGATARSQRRTRFAGVAAAVVLVTAGASVTGVVLARDDGGSSSGSSSGSSYDARADAAGGAAQSRRNAQQPAAAPSPSSSDSAASRTACPATFPQRMLPGGGMAGMMFDRPVAVFTVCAYGSPLQGPNPSVATISGADATELQSSLENARRTPAGTTCGAIRTAEKRNIALIPSDAAGRNLRTITTTLAIPVCDTRTTNGITVRFGWVPPRSVARVLYPTAAPGSVSPLPNRSPSGKVIGSPVR